MTDIIRRFCVGCQEQFATTFECTVHGITCEEHLHMFEGSVYEKKVRAMMAKHNNAEIVARTCLGCERVCKNEKDFYSHWKQCEKAKSILKKPRGMVQTKNGAVLQKLHTCRGCKLTFQARNELHRHYCTCLKNLEFYKGTDYYNQQKTFLERMQYDPKKAESTCPGCYTVFSGHRNLSAHRFHCKDWIQVSKAQEVQDKSEESYVEEMKPYMEPEHVSFTSLVQERKKNHAPTYINPKEASHSDFYIGIVKPTTTPTTAPIMVSAETQTEKPSCIKFGNDQIKEIPNTESEEYKLEKAYEDSLCPPSQPQPPTIPLQIQGMWVRMNDQVYYVPPQVVHAIAYLATPVPVPGSV